MSAFDKVIGYETIKKELVQLCDMIHNKEIYENMGAKLPQGILLYGDPGLGKTLIAKCFIEETGIKSFVIRRNKGDNEFVEGISEIFEKAKKEAPAIIFLDDMDKFANEDDDHKDAEEYVVVQSGIDEVKSCDVFILATANNIHKLPESLIRAGRFDRKIEVFCPNEEDTSKIMEHFLATKKISNDINMQDLSRMISYSSCAELETILNEAAISAAYNRKETIGMQDIVEAVLRKEYNAPDNYTKASKEELQKRALHEAGHVVISEVLDKESVGLVSIRSTGRDSLGGFMHRCKNLKRRVYDILISLGGKAAVELYYSETCASGCHSDLEKAFTNIRTAISESGTLGFGMLDVETRRSPITSEAMNARTEVVVQAEMERYLFQSRNILLKNKDFLEKVTEKLLEKETLLYSDIQAIREQVKVVEVVV